MFGAKQSYFSFVAPHLRDGLDKQAGSQRQRLSRRRGPGTSTRFVVDGLHAQLAASADGVSVRNGAADAAAGRPGEGGTDCTIATRRRIAAAGAEDCEAGLISELDRLDRLVEKLAKAQACATTFVRKAYAAKLQFQVDRLVDELARKV